MADTFTYATAVRLRTRMLILSFGRIPIHINAMWYHVRVARLKLRANAAHSQA